MSTIGNGPVLIAYDGSDDARHAIETAGELFAGRKAIVLHVWSPVALIASRYGAMVALPASSDQQIEDAALTISAEGVAIASEAGLDARPESAECTDWGTWHAILDAADEYEASVIVIGARGLSSFKSFVLGSVSHGVAQHAHRAVLVVPHLVRSDRAPAAAQHATVPR
jgi:nucleotide-binding universal stress UspA family protein